MTRYIDAEKINYHKMSVCEGHGLNFEYTVANKHEVDAIPTADVVEVVRCRDCKYARGNLVAIGICDCLMYRDIRKGDDFCNYGEVKK